MGQAGLVLSAQTQATMTAFRAMHTQHHRGQCMTRLKDFGQERRLDQLAIESQHGAHCCWRQDEVSFP
jgi:hypothetical protein